MPRLRMPTAGTPYIFPEIASTFQGFWKDQQLIADFEEQLATYFRINHVRLVNSGTTANFILYRLFKQIRPRAEQDEVILPAYTAPSLLLPIEAAGLKPVLVDIDVETFNLDVKKIANKLSGRTLAVMPIHMFGLPNEVAPVLNLVKGRGIFVLEDSASALGSKLDNAFVGTIAPFGFFSLNRGKNISTLAGGIITWQEDAHTDAIDGLCAELPALSQRSQLLMTLKIAALSLAVKPLYYTLMTPIISKFKYTTLHTHFDSFRYTTAQAAMGQRLWRRADALTKRRVDNGTALHEIFKDKPGIRLPRAIPVSEVAFNQFPLVIDDLSRRQALEQMLLAKGLETTRLYEHPLHHIFPYLNESGPDLYPHASYLAEHLLLIPPHAQIREKHMQLIKDSVDAIF